MTAHHSLLLENGNPAQEMHGWAHMENKPKHQNHPDLKIAKTPSNYLPVLIMHAHVFIDVM
jgi:hypothetical protein